MGSICSPRSGRRCWRGEATSMSGPWLCTPAQLHWLHELLTCPAWMLTPRKSAFLLLHCQISIRVALSRYVHYRPRVSQPGGAQQPLLGVQHPCHQHRLSLGHLGHRHGHWGQQICRGEPCSALGSHLPVRVSPPRCAPPSASL